METAVFRLYFVAVCLMCVNLASNAQPQSLKSFNLRCPDDTVVDISFLMDGTHFELNQSKRNPFTDNKTQIMLLRGDYVTTNKNQYLLKTINHPNLYISLSSEGDFELKGLNTNKEDWLCVGLSFDNR